MQDVPKLITNAEDARELFAQIFELLIVARNSEDAEALQEAIDLAATASCRTMDF